VGAGATGILLALSFPPAASAEAAWLALVPLLLAVRAADRRFAFWLGMSAGAVWWLISIHWLTYVTVLGWLILCLYCAVYVGLFARIAARWLRRYPGDRWLPNLGFMAYTAAAWVGLEWLRATLFTGFPWNTLGTSQFEVVPIRQMAAWTGVYGVSAVLVFFNAGVAATALRYTTGRARGNRTAHPELAAAFLVMALPIAAGIRVVRHDRLTATPLHVGLIQPSIPQFDKWVPETQPLIYRRLLELTEAAQAATPLDLVIWPETALPDDVRYSPESYQLTQYLARDRAPILVGSMDFVRTEDGGVRYYNSAFLFDTAGDIAAAYDKQHLIVFGEYIPWFARLPFLRALTPNMESFSPGRKTQVFELAHPDVRFSALICFEDAIPGLSRRAVTEGARMLAILTNDAWFRQSSASRQHLAHCVFRCIENRVPAVRAANNGMTCAIDHFGSVHTQLTDNDGTTFGPGWISAWVMTPPQDMPLTPYTRYGDWFAYTCLALAAAGCLASRTRHPTIRNIRIGFRDASGSP
jgi:apolipoprotein N-acyltransferase